MPGDGGDPVAEAGEAILVRGDAQNPADHRDFALALEQFRDVLAREFAGVAIVGADIAELCRAS